MNKKKIIFYIITVSLLLISSIGIYCSYDIMQSEKKKPNFSNNNILYDILEKYQGGNCSVIIRHSLKGLLDRKSPFAEFKRSYIRHQKDRYPELMRFIN